VVGVDESYPYIGYATEQAAARGLGHAVFLEGDAASADEVLPSNGHDPASFDLVYLRWVLCFVPDPGRVIQAAAKMLKPGGRLCVQDYFRYESMTMAPQSPCFDEVIHAIGKSWREHGGDPDVMGRVPGLAIEAGLEVRELARVESETPRPGSTMWSWPGTFWPVYLPRLKDLGYITAGQHREFLELWDARSSDPSAFIHLPPVYEMIAVKQ
jgi:SAM-dependent methyltransferase